MGSTCSGEVSKRYAGDFWVQRECLRGFHRAFIRGYRRGFRTCQLVVIVEEVAINSLSRYVLPR